MTSSRLDYWTRFINENDIRKVVEVGVWRGEFAEHMLTHCPAIERYYLVDPWMVLDNWNKPLNTPDLEAAHAQTLERMAPFGDKVVILRGKTADVAVDLPDDLDLAYIDGDHTLRGIVIDMLKIWPRIREGGFLAGDDFSPGIWQHGRKFEPTMVFPFAVHFAEGVDCPITSPMAGQYYIEKNHSGFSFDDRDAAYPSTEMLPQMGGLLGRLLR